MASFSDLERDLKKKKDDMSEDEEIDFQQVKKQRACSSKKKTDPKKSASYDLILVQDGSNSKIIPPYSVYVGKGVAVEIKEFRKYHYICFSKTIEGDVKNRFNLPVEQVGNLKKAIDAISLYLKDYM